MSVLSPTMPPSISDDLLTSADDLITSIQNVLSNLTFYTTHACSATVVVLLLWPFLKHIAKIWKRFINYMTYFLNYNTGQLKEVFDFDGLVPFWNVFHDAVEDELDGDISAFAVYLKVYGKVKNNREITAIFHNPLYFSDKIKPYGRGDSLNDEVRAYIKYKKGIPKTEDEKNLKRFVRSHQDYSDPSKVITRTRFMLSIESTKQSLSTESTKQSLSTESTIQSLSTDTTKQLVLVWAEHEKIGKTKEKFNFIIAENITDGSLIHLDTTVKQATGPKTMELGNLSNKSSVSANK